MRKSYVLSGVFYIIRVQPLSHGIFFENADKFEEIYKHQSWSNFKASGQLREIAFRGHLHTTKNNVFFSPFLSLLN
jgi:hypothetical protein